MKSLSAYIFRLSHRRRQGNANADFLYRLPVPPTEKDISGSSALPDPDDFRVYVINACDYTAPLCPTQALAWVDWPHRPILPQAMERMGVVPLRRLLRSWVGNLCRKTSFGHIVLRNLHCVCRVPQAALSGLLAKKSVLFTQLNPGMIHLGLTVLNAREAKLTSNFDRQRPIAPRLSQGCPPWVHSVRRSSTSSEGPVSLITTSALGPPRLRDFTGSFFLTSPDVRSPPNHN